MVYDCTYVFTSSVFALFCILSLNAFNKGETLNESNCTLANVDFYDSCSFSIYER